MDRIDWRATRFLTGFGLAVLLVIGSPDTALLATPAASPGAAWTWENPRPQGNHLRGVSCPSPTVCVAVGDAGTILTTGDGGSTWRIRDSGTTQDLKAVSCASARTCVTVGGSFPGTSSDGLATILVTSDSGATWTNGPNPVTPVPYTTGLLAISCPSTTTCFAAGLNEVIAATTDGGLTWVVKNSSTLSDITGISCPSTSTCVAITNWPGRILSTSDGGATWARAPTGLVPSPMVAVDCPSASTCFVAGGEGLIAVSRDAGATWTRQTLPIPYYLRGISCPGVNTCFAVGAANADAATEKLPAIFATTDGGAAWRFQSGGTFARLGAISCPTEVACSAVGDGGAILTTADGGATWVRRSSGVSSLAELQGISCPSRDRCVAVGDRVASLVTGDGGKTWTATFPGYQQGNLNAVSCPSTSTCFAAAADSGGFFPSVLGTTDGGYTWQERLRSLPVGLTGISCPSVNSCFAVGGPGVILATTDGGVNWTLQNSQDGLLLFGVSCPSVSTCYAVGNGGRVLITSDAGASWTTRFWDQLRSRSLGAVDCPTVDICFASGFHREIMVTRDAGVSWTETSPAFETQGFVGVTCPTVVNCFAIGGYGVVIATVDGRTWTRQAAPTHEIVRGVSCQAARCHVVGDHTIILGGGGPAAEVGGKGFGLTMATRGAPLLSWTRGTLQDGYQVLRGAIQTGAVEALPTDPSLLPAPAQSYRDPSRLDQPEYCYQVMPWADSASQGTSDEICVYPGTRSASGGPDQFTLRLNESNVASLTWAGPGGQDGYVLKAIPETGAPRLIPFAGTATSGTDDTGGVTTCYVLAPVAGSSMMGNSDVLCAVPGQATIGR